MNVGKVFNMGEQNMGDYETLISFIEWGVQKYPAYHYVLVPMDHGDGIGDCALTRAPAAGLSRKRTLPSRCDSRRPHGRFGRL